MSLNQSVRRLDSSSNLDYDRSLSWSEKLMFSEISFKAAGQFKVCVCENGLSDDGSGCFSPAAFPLEAARVHVTQASCLLEDSKRVTASCETQVRFIFRKFKNCSNYFNLFSTINYDINFNFDQ